MKRYLELSAITVLLVLGFGVRLYKINNPIADWHSWRQADTAAVTRNFVKHGVNMLLPRYDDLSDVGAKGFNLAGYRLVEFPLFNLIHYIFYSLSPIHYSLEAWGRMVSVLASLVSSVCLYILVKKSAGIMAGMASMGAWLFIPFNIYFSRVILPEPLMVALALLSLVCLQKSRWLSYSLAILAVLVKPTAIFIALPILASWRFAPVLIFMPFLVWRMWQLQYPEGVPGSSWLLNGDHIRFKGAFFRWIFGDRLGRLILGYWGIWPAIEGTLSLAKELWWLFGGAIAYLFIFATGNVRHDYYQIPIMPAVAIAVGMGIAVIWRQGGWLRRGGLVVAVMFMLAFGWYEVRGNYQINNPAILAAGQAADRLLPADAVVIADYNGDTAFLYQINRRGFPNVPLPIPEMVSGLGATHYVSVTYDDRTNQLRQQYPVLEQTPQYVILRLEP